MIPITVTNAPPAAAATYTVHDGASLAAAVQSADAQPGPSTIDLLVGAYAPDATLTISGDLELVGPAVDGAKIVGDAVVPTGADLFDVASTAHVTFVDVALTNAGSNGGGAAIDDAGDVEIDSSTLAGDDGAGLVVEPGATATVSDSTFADGLAAGIVDDGSATLTNSTVADNAVEGIDDSEGALTLINTIVADNGSADCTAPAQSSDASLDSDGSCGVGALSSSAPKLGPLVASNGGPTPTQALAPGSPAVGAADASRCPSADQRGYARPATGCDIGAYQTGAQPSTTTTTTTTTAVATPAAATGSQPAAPAPTAAQPQPATGGAASPTTARAIVAVNGSGSLRGAGRSRISFTVHARETRPHGSFAYHDPAARVWLKAATVTSVAIGAAGSQLTISGSGVDLPRRRVVRFTATLVDRAGARRLSIRLSNGYMASGPLLSAAIAPTRAAVAARHA